MKRLHTYIYRKKNMASGLMLVMLMAFFYSCSDTSTSTAPPEPPPCEVDNSCEDDDDSTDTDNDYNYQSDYAYNLNVIYFVPNDVNPRPRYHERLSGFLLYYQDYYKKWMDFWGYGDTTFGLLKDKEAERVKITVIEGNHPVSYYPNDSNGNATGGRRAREEIKEYFESNPDIQPDSKHYLVYMPRPDPKPTAGLPYYGLGRWAFVVDKDQDPNNAENSGGGDAHELGHAINLPHNANSRSRKQSIGIALMNNGNHTWNNGPGSSGTALTEASTAILDVSQVTSKEQKTFYGDVNIELEAAAGRYENGEIVIGGRYNSDVPVTSSIVVLDVEGKQNYDQIGFRSSISATDSFNVRIDTNDLFKTQNGYFGLKLWLVHENGVRTFYNLPNFSFNNSVPDVEFRLGAVPTLSKTDWVVTDFSDQAVSTGKLAENIIDGDFGTWWHSDFEGGNDPHPHTLTIDMGKKQTVEGFQFAQAPDSKRRSRIRRMEIKVSNDGSTWTSLGEFKLNNTKLPQTLNLSEAKDFRYFKIFTLESWESPDWDASSLAEVGVF